MKQQSRSTGRSRPQTSIVGGFNIYHDDKNRTIYYNRLSKRAYIIKPNDFNTFSVEEYGDVVAIIIEGV